MDTPTPSAPAVPAPSAPPPPSISPMFQMILTKLIADMRFVAIMHMVLGALYCLTIFGAIVGIPILIGGLRLREAADSMIYYLSTKDMRMLESALERQSRFFFIQKVIMIVAMVMIVFYILFIISFGLSMFRLMHSFGRFGV